MEIRLSPELQDKLRRMASQQGRDQESLVQGAVERLIDYDEWFERQVNAGLAQIDRGETREDGEVVEHMEQLIARKQARR
jgi:predicted transcriptional regulator